MAGPLLPVAGSDPRSRSRRDDENARTFSPPVMRLFIRDRLSKMVIGLLAATFVYCVLTLRHIGTDRPHPRDRR